MSNDFVHISGLGIYRKDTIKKVVPLHKPDYKIDVTPPFTKDDDFVFRLLKSTEVVAAVFFDGEEEETVDEDSKAIVWASVEFNFDEITAELYADDNKDLETIRKSYKNYKIRVKKIAEHEEKLKSLDAAKGSPSYDSLVAALNEGAPNNDGQEDRVAKISSALNEQLASIVPSEEDDDEVSPIFALLNNEEGEKQIKEAARSVLEDFNMRLNGYVNGYYNEKIGGEGVDTDEDFDEEDIEKRLTEVSPEAARSRAFDILSSSSAITNHTLEDEEDLTKKSDLEDESELDDEDEDESEEKIEVKP